MRSLTQLSSFALLGLLGLAAQAEPAALPWINRLSYGVNATTWATWQSEGARGYINEQLHPDVSVQLQPAAAEQEIEQLQDLAMPLEQRMLLVQTEQKRINGLSEADKPAARSAFNEQANHFFYETQKRHLLRAIYSPAQLQEQMVQFWLNHFNVFYGKGNLRWLAADYEDRAIRPYALGRFRDLLFATMTHPAMLEYLDNAQNAAGKINENYARELLELHTMGVNSGYSQRDVQELARVLTGLGVNFKGETPRWPARMQEPWQSLYVAHNGFEFNPARHDFGDKTVLGVSFQGSGMAEIDAVADLLSRQPATAHLICHQLAQFFVADDPPESLVSSMSHVFLSSKGDIAATLKAMFASREFAASLGQQFRDPQHFVVASLRFAYDGKVVSNLKPAMNWLNQLGQPLLGHLTPDGYSLLSSAWASSGQMTKRFEIARAIGSGNAGLFNDEDGKPLAVGGFPMLANRLFFDHIQSTLRPATLSVLDQAQSQAEWNMYLLASPDWMQR